MSDNPNNMYYENYDMRKGWVETNPGWYEVCIPKNAGKIMVKYIEVLNWVYENIDNCERHARWTFSTENIYFRFRYEKDYLFFVLRWG